jgi:hypothetical protein
MNHDDQIKLLAYFLAAMMVLFAVQTFWLARVDARARVNTKVMEIFHAEEPKLERRCDQPSLPFIFHPSML